VHRQPQIKRATSENTKSASIKKRTNESMYLTNGRASINSWGKLPNWPLVNAEPKRKAGCRWGRLRVESPQPLQARRAQGVPSAAP
jgi:hypothetical protein